MHFSSPLTMNYSRCDSPFSAHTCAHVRLDYRVYFVLQGVCVCVCVCVRKCVRERERHQGLKWKWKSRTLMLQVAPQPLFSVNEHLSISSCRGKTLQMHAHTHAHTHTHTHTHKHTHTPVFNFPSCCFLFVTPQKKVITGHCCLPFLVPIHSVAIRLNYFCFRFWKRQAWSNVTWLRLIHLRHKPLLFTPVSTVTEGK